MKTTKEILLNYISLVIMAVSGLIINYIIIRNYNSSVLGIYNEAYAWYMILSQIAVCGIHMAVVKHVPEYEQIDDKRRIMYNAVFISGITSVIVILGVLFAIVFIEFEWKNALFIAVFGLFFYSINKVLLNYLNAINKMAIYAIVQIVRYILMCSVACIIAYLRMNGDCITFIFPVSEFGICLLLIMILRCIDTENSTHRDSISLRDCKTLLSFGIRILPSNMVLEMNSKVDVVCLGFLVGDISVIGVYSFAILFTDGMYQLFTILRKIINPYISGNNARGVLKEYLEGLFEKTKKYLLAMSALGFLGIIIVYYVICFYFAGPEYIQGVVYVAIIGASIVITGRHIILGDILAQTGFPWDESKINLLTVMINFMMNLMLILLVGVKGAAIATAVSYIAFATLLKLMCKRKLQLEI